VGSENAALEGRAFRLSLQCSTYGFEAAKANTGTISIRTRIQTTKAALNMEPSITRIPIIVDF
jgi:hypothetical protein